MLFDMNDSQLRETLASQVRQSQAHAGLRRPSNSSLRIRPASRSRTTRIPRGSRSSTCGWPPRISSPTAAILSTEPWTGPPATGQPSPTAPTSEAWSVSAQRLLDATEEMARIVENPDVDLHATVPTGEKQHHNALRASAHPDRSQQLSCGPAHRASSGPEHLAGPVTPRRWRCRQ